MTELSELCGRRKGQMVRYCLFGNTHTTNVDWVRGMAWHGMTWHGRRRLEAWPAEQELRLHWVMMGFHGYRAANNSNGFRGKGNTGSCLCCVESQATTKYRSVHSTPASRHPPSSPLALSPGSTSPIYLLPWTKSQSDRHSKKAWTVDSFIISPYCFVSSYVSLKPTC